MNEMNSLFEENLQQEEVQNPEAISEEQTLEVISSVDEAPISETTLTEQPSDNEDLAEIDTQEQSDVQEVVSEQIDSAEQPGDSDDSAEPESDEQADDNGDSAESETAEQSDDNADSTESDSTDETEPEVPEIKTIPYHERYYLRYHEGKRTTELDLGGTKTFLQELGFDGGELRKAREGKDCAETYKNVDKGKGNQMTCSYCGSEISGVDFYRLPDGRMRCTTCSSTVIKTKAEIEEICQRVVSNMDSFFGATIDVAVSIDVLDERKLKKKIGVPLGTKDSQSVLILGVAVNKKKKYHILLENGAPRLSLIATFAHELTHIWQYTHWDNKKNFKKCSKEKRLLIYEGMAKWVEIQYLYLVGETNAARREEYITRTRQDEYGKGFCMCEDLYPLSRETMVCGETPFTPNNYPFE